MISMSEPHQRMKEDYTRHLLHHIRENECVDHKTPKYSGRDLQHELS